MRKISNNQSNILVGPRIPKIVQKREDIKESLNEISKLSSEIDRQFRMNQQNKQRKSLQNDIKIQLEQTKGRQIKKKRQNNEDCKKQVDSLELKEYSGQKYEDFEITSTDKAVYASLNQYYGLDLSTSDLQINNEEYEEFKKIKQFNKDFIEIQQNLEKLRKFSLTSHHISNVATIQTEFDIIKLIKSICLTNNNNYERANAINRQICHSKDSTNLIEVICKLQGVKQTIESKLQHLQDDIQYKKRVISQLKSNQNNILDDIEIIQSRNNKILRELNLKSTNNRQNTSQEQEQSQQQKQQPQKQEKSEKQNQVQGQEEEYEREYLQIMQYYQLYDPQTQIITSPFPKNKTQVMFLLNQLDSQLTQLQLKNTLQLYNNPN